MFSDINDCTNSISSPASYTSGRRKGIHVPNDQAVKLLDNLLVDASCSLDYELDSRNSFDYDPTTASRHQSSCSKFISPGSIFSRDSQSLDTNLTEDDFIKLIGRTFSLPYTGGELDWMRDLDYDLRLNPTRALLHSSFEQSYMDANNKGGFSSDERHHIVENDQDGVNTPLAGYESFLNIDDDDEEGSAETEREAELSELSNRYHFSFCDVEGCPCGHQRQIIRVVLPQVYQHDVWKRPYQKTYIPPKKNLLTRCLRVVKKFTRALFC